MITLDPIIAIAALLLAGAFGFIAGIFFAEWLDYRHAQRDLRESKP